MLCRWALNEGQDFVVNNQVAGIDFATLHCWPDKCGQQHAVTREGSPHTAYSISSRPSACSWLDDDLQFQSAWVRQHAADAAALGKPVRTASETAPACITGSHTCGNASQQA